MEVITYCIVSIVCCCILGVYAYLEHKRYKRLMDFIDLMSSYYQIQLDKEKKEDLSSKNK